MFLRLLISFDIIFISDFQQPSEKEMNVDFEINDFENIKPLIFTVLIAGIKVWTFSGISSSGIVYCLM